MNFNKYTQNIYSNGLLKWKHQLGSRIYISIQVDFLLSFHLKMSYRVLVYDTWQEKNVHSKKITIKMLTKK